MNELIESPGARSRIVIAGAGYAGYHCARRLERLLPREAAEIVIVSPTDYMPYTSLLPQVGAGTVDPRHIAVSLSATLRRTRHVPGYAVGVDFGNRSIAVAGPDGQRRELGWNRLVLTPGSVSRTLPLPGILERAKGFNNIAEALYLRDHVLGQMELADASDDPAQRQARCTFVVVGAGYTGTEVAAHGQLLTRDLARGRDGLRDQQIRWLLVDRAGRVLPELSPRLAQTARRTLTRRGVEIRTRTTIVEAARGGVRLSSGEFVPARSLIWCVGVRPDPLIEALGLPTANGRLTVDEYLSVPGHLEVFSCGDIAAVPDLTRPGQITGMTAQHAVRQGKLAARNIAASLGLGSKRAYRHRDLGFVVDLAGTKAAADPLGVPLAGWPAKLVTRGYHLLSLPANRVRVASDWVLDAVLPRQSVQFGLVRGGTVPLSTADPGASVHHVSVPGGPA